MAVSKSWSSDTGAPPRRRYFTIDEAHRALPLVKRVVADVVRTHEEATLLHTHLEVRQSVATRDHIQHQLEAAVDRLGDLIDELKAIGCELKDYRTGLVNFVGRHQGRDILLCWQHGEPAIERWHELHATVDGQQPVSLLRE